MNVIAATAQTGDTIVNVEFDHDVVELGTPIGWMVISNGAPLTVDALDVSPANTLILELLDPVGDNVTVQFNGAGGITFTGDATLLPGEWPVTVSSLDVARAESSVPETIRAFHSAGSRQATRRRPPNSR